MDSAPIAVIEVVVQELGLQPDFMNTLLSGDDWSMVIKSHALLESLITQVVLFHLARPELGDFVSRLTMRHKIQMLDALAPTCIGAESRRVLTALGALRNRLVHNVAQTGYSFDTDYRSRDERTQFRKTYWWPLDPTQAEDDVELNLKTVLWLGVLMTASSMRLAVHRAQEDGR